jgi:hypothetical protein
LIPTAEEEKEMREVAKMLRELSKKSHEKAVDLTRRLSVLQMELGRREAAEQPVEDLEAEIEEIERKIEKLVALRNRAHGAANEADEFWDKWLREKRRLTDESGRAGKYDSSTEKLYRLVRKLIEEGGIREDEEWWEEVLEFVDDDWVSRFSGLVIWKAIEALRLAKLRLSLWEADSDVRLAKQRHGWGPPVSAEWLEWKMLHRIDWEEAEKRKESFIWNEIIREIERIGVEQIEAELLGGETVREVRPTGDVRYLQLTAPDLFREEISELVDCLKHLRSEAEDRSSVRACVEVLKDCIRIVNDMKDRLAVKASENTLRAFQRIAGALNRLGRRAEEWLVENASLPLRKQFVDEKEEERQWLRGRALDIIRSAKHYLERLSEGMLEDIIYNRLRGIVSGVSVDLSDLSDNIKRARELLAYLELQMEKEKPDVEMVNEICGRLEMLLQPLKERIEEVFEEVKGQVEAARERIKLPFLGEDELKRIANVIYRLDDIVSEIPEYAKELRKPIRRPRAPKVKPRFGWLP